MAVKAKRHPLLIINMSSSSKGRGLWERVGLSGVPSSDSSLFRCMAGDCGLSVWYEKDTWMTHFLIQNFKKAALQFPLLFTVEKLTTMETTATASAAVVRKCGVAAEWEVAPPDRVNLVFQDLIFGKVNCGIFVSIS
ncbi:unnamed protein product [Cuscuta campestris]|uniref:Uncharacterized protein n=1 Tax=Cuscuta campestris TaxID=132261 RepID=A0A484LPI9_9ASTE|nr:unnamed protein product [Cuscuta campestris]